MHFRPDAAVMLAIRGDDRGIVAQIDRQHVPRHAHRPTFCRDSPRPIDAERDDVARLQVHRRRLHAEPDAGGRAGADDVAGQSVMNWLT